MAKIKLGERPKSFKHTVKFPTLEGEQGAIEMTFRYRTRIEYGEFVDEWQRTRRARAEAQAEQMQREYEATVKAAADAGLPAPPPPEIKSGDFQRKVAEAMADFIVEIADGWNLDAPFNTDNVLQLANELPAAAEAIQSSYRTALTEGRLGN